MTMPVMLEIHIDNCFAGLVEQEDDGSWRWSAAEMAPEAARRVQRLWPTREALQAALVAAAGGDPDRLTERQL